VAVAANITITVIGADRVTIKLTGIALAVRATGRATVGSALKYAPPVHFGFGPRNIYPRVKRALWWPGLSHPIPMVGPPVTRVHPGYKGNQYLYEATDARLGEIGHLAEAGVAVICETGAGTVKDLVVRPAAGAVLAEAQSRVNVKSGALKRSLQSQVYSR
jgi:hypothetical protein